MAAVTSRLVHPYISQCCNVKFGAGVLGMPASGRHSHKGRRRKRETVAPYLLRVSARLLLSCGVKYSLIFVLAWMQVRDWIRSGLNASERLDSTEMDLFGGPGGFWWNCLTPYMQTCQKVQSHFTPCFLYRHVKKNQLSKANFRFRNGEGKGEIEPRLAVGDCLACKGVDRSWGQPYTSSYVTCHIILYYIYIYVCHIILYYIYIYT